MGFLNFFGKKTLPTTVSDFAHANKTKLIIVADPANDTIFVSFRDKVVFTHIKSATGRRTHVIRDVLKASQFKYAIDDFIVAIAEAMQLSLPKGNQLYQALDGALFNIAQSLRAPGSSAKEPPPGAIPSPLTVGRGPEVEGSEDLSENN